MNTKVLDGLEQQHTKKNGKKQEKRKLELIRNGFKQNEQQANPQS